jgi:predicted transcriptional regulator
VTPDLRRKGPRQAVAFKLQSEAVDKLRELAEKHGINLTEAAEMAIEQLHALPETALLGHEAKKG